VTEALLVVSFGGPEGPDDVLPFLKNVARGRPIPAARLAEVAAHYQQFGGVSPINGHNRRLVATLSASDLGLPVYLGNRNWHPMLADTVAQMAEDGVDHAWAFVTSAFSSYSGCRQYLDDIEAARAALGDRAPVIEKLRVFYNHPGFLGAVAAQVDAVLADVPARSPLIFTAHSIPLTMASQCRYEAQLREAAGLVTGILGGERPWQLAYQSRSGPSHVPWLGPDVGEVLRRMSGANAPGAVLVPIGFVCDHMEVVYDLDVLAVREARSLGLPVTRAGTVGVHPEFVAMIGELVAERRGALRRFRGDVGPRPDQCHPDCCRPAP
jgi:protoporphyrin/coproporphyrin ferrochelatase